MSDKTQGLYNKYTVTRNDGSPKHENCEYFVLDLDHDPFAIRAIVEYALSCQDKYPLLARDLMAIARSSDLLDSELQIKPE